MNNSDARTELMRETMKGVYFDNDGLENVLCLGTLIAVGELPVDSLLKDSKNYFESVVKSQCPNCKYTNRCLACIMNRTRE